MEHKCSVCGAEFASSEELASHMSSAHPEGAGEAPSNEGSNEGSGEQM